MTGTLSSPEAWISVMPASFDTNNVTINVTVDNEVLNQKEGGHTGTISITSNGGDAIVTVALTATCVLVRPNPNDGSFEFFGDGLVEGQTIIKIYTLSGKLVAQTNETSVKLELANGVYIYTYESPREKGVGKFTVINR